VDPVSDQRSKNRITLYTRNCNIHLILMTAYKSIFSTNYVIFFKCVWLTVFWLTVCGLGSRQVITTRFSVFKKKKREPQQPSIFHIWIQEWTARPVPIMIRRIECLALPPTVLMASQVDKFVNYDQLTVSLIPARNYELINSLFQETRRKEHYFPNPHQQNDE
jgi:hypothetical protein